ncbi:hypothetical protein K4K58_003208 [Colletotrichum sp. SAR11_239]|nr:hypothetical protein K4K58_003208 [Colletotrichum sp. SAR11_239]
MDPGRFYKALLYAASAAVFYLVAPLYASLCLAWSVHYTRESIRYWSLDELLLRHASMLVTLAAVIWLLHRAWQTLWKPTTDLISILGVDVPEAPDVSLAGIKNDAATLNWTRPSHNRPVQKFLIQVNGVNVGESRSEETAITVTGLRPNHCYNIRVIAVGPNNFQAGSQVIRLRTYRSDGRPELGNSRLPDSFQDQEPRSSHSQCTEENGGRSQVPTIEAAPSIEPGSATAREPATSAGQRRNTVNRRHSPSIASQEQPTIKDLSGDHPEASLKDLADTLEKQRKEIDDTAALHTTEETEFRQLEQRLKKERDEKKRVQKEKDDATAQLKQKVKASYEQMRQASKDKAKKENQLKEKQDKLKKVRDNIDKWTTDIENMRKTREGFAAEKENLEKDRDLKVKTLIEENAALQEEFDQLEAEYKEKRQQLKELEDERKKLPGGEEDDTWREDDRKMKRDFETKRRELQSQLIMENRKAQQLDGHLHMLNAQMYAATQQGINFFNQANSSGVDFEQNVPVQIKRRSRTGNSMSNAAVPSPTGLYSASDSPRPSIHGSPAALKTTLASEQDEILRDEVLKDPSQVGVIGSRPPGNKLTADARTLSGRLNPAAPTFIGGLFGWKEKDGDPSKDKDKLKSKDKSKDKGKDTKEKAKGRDASAPSLDLPQGYDSSPNESRKSRDAFSIHTQTSVSESRESLTLDRALSSTLSDPNSIAKDQENVVRKLFRKGSSSKFSLSSRLSKESGLFKKGPGSTTNSDKNMSAERSSFGDIDDYGEEGLLGRSYESVSGSPSFGPSKSKESKESRMTGWSSKFSMKKKGKDNKETPESSHRALDSDVDEEKKDI